MNNKNVFLGSMAGILLVFTIVYFVVATKMSYAFTYDEDKERYDSKISSIIDSAKSYAEKNPDLFADTDTIYVTVNELIEKQAIIPDDTEGNVKDPSNENNNLNSLKIRLTYKDDVYDAVVLYN